MQIGEKDLGIDIVVKDENVLVAARRGGFYLRCTPNKPPDRSVLIGSHVLYDFEDVCDEFQQFYRDLADHGKLTVNEATGSISSLHNIGH